MSWATVLRANSSAVEVNFLSHGRKGRRISAFIARGYARASRTNSPKNLDMLLTSLGFSPIRTHSWDPSGVPAKVLAFTFACPCFFQRKISGLRHSSKCAQRKSRVHRHALKRRMVPSISAWHPGRGTGALLPATRMHFAGRASRRTLVALAGKSPHRAVQTPVQCLPPLFYAEWR